MFDNGSEFKLYFTPLLKYFNIKPVLTTIKKLQANAPVKRVYQLTLNMLVTKDLDKKVFDYIYPWCETLVSIAWALRDSYHSTIHAMSCQSVFGIYIIFNLTSVLDWRVITTGKQQQVDIGNLQ